MQSVELTILEPQHDCKIAYPAQVHLRGAMLSTGVPPLYYKWYSSLWMPSPDSNPPELNYSNHQQLDFTIDLPVGANIITFTAKDIEGDSADNIKSVAFAGMSGGPGPENPKNPKCCIVHRYKAQIIAPDTGANVSKTHAVLEAAAPVKWGKENPEVAGTYVIDPEYHSINRILYHWYFAPQGDPAGRKSADFKTGKDDLTFGFKDGLPRVQYNGALPVTLGTGLYTLTLRVEDKDDPSIGHQTNVSVMITV